MPKGLPTKAKVGAPGKSVSIDTATYFLATRMESVGMLRPGQALMLAASASVQLMYADKSVKKGKRK